MDNAQAWCMNIEDMYNKAEVHSINTSKGHTADVEFFLIMLKRQYLNFLKQMSLPILVGGIASRKLTGYITSNFLKRLDLSLYLCLMIIEG